jgi:PAS domain S-box-containing protein
VGTKRPLRVLVVEDREDDAILVLRQLSRGGYTSAWERVETADGLTDALARQSWDVVLADYSLPHFGALEALEIVRRSSEDLPFIVVSGTIDEATAVAAMRAGAQDFVTKAHLARLVPAVERELREAEVRSERRRAAEAARHSDERFRELTELLPEIVVELDARGVLTYVNRQAFAATGYDSEDLRAGLPLVALAPEADRPAVEALLARLLAGEESGPSEIVARRKDGSTWPVQLRTTPILRDGVVVGLRGILFDISRHKAAEEALRQSQEDLAITLNSIGDGVIAADGEGRVAHMNPVAEELTGWAEAEARGHALEEVLALRDRPTRAALPSPAGRVLSSGRTEQIEGDVLVLSREGRERVVAGSAAPIRARDGALRGAVVVIRDMSEQQRLEMELRQAQKMESLGRLAGGVAHDFNNLLGAILGYCDIMLLDLNEVHPLRRDIEEVARSAKRAAALTRQLLAFSRRQIAEPRILDLNGLIGAMERMLVRVIGEDVQLVVRLADRLPRVQVDPGQLEQVVMNLSVNARDAMPGGGTLLIETVDVWLGDENWVRRHPFIKPGRHALVAVSDTGVGMDEATQARIFEPFFTTKAEGKGTGLGLSTVYAIVQQAGGAIRVFSEPGKGTTLQLYLPSAPADAVLAADAEETEVASGGDETILLVEDETSLRSLLSRILTKKGYHVLAARSGDEALRQAEDAAADIDLVVTDVVMPHMSGPEVVERLTRMHPRMKVLFMSGYSSEAIVHHGVLRTGLAFIEKPFSAEELASRVRKVLDGAA